MLRSKVLRFVRCAPVALSLYVDGPTDGVLSKRAASIDQVQFDRHCPMRREVGLLHWKTLSFYVAMDVRLLENTHGLISFSILPFPKKLGKTVRGYCVCSRVWCRTVQTEE